MLSDDDQGSFTSAHAILSSDYIYEFIVKQFMAQLWGCIVPDGGKFDPYLFETYCTVLLCDSEQQGTSNNFMVKDSALIKSASSNITLKKCKGKQKVENIIESARHEADILFLPLSMSNKLIDFVFREDSTYYCFQCTIAATHSANPNHMYTLVLNVINLSEEESKNIKPTDALPCVKIYYAVPHNRYADFHTIPVKAKADARKLCKTGLLYHWDKLVSIEILSIPEPSI